MSATPAWHSRPIFISSTFRDMHAKRDYLFRFDGYYSNKSRGLRKKVGTDDEVLALIDSDISRKAFRKNWARLIQKIYPVKFPKGNPIKQCK